MDGQVIMSALGTNQTSQNVHSPAARALGAPGVFPTAEGVTTGIVVVGGQGVSWRDGYTHVDQATDHNI